MFFWLQFCFSGAYILELILYCLNDYIFIVILISVESIVISPLSILILVICVFFLFFPDQSGQRSINFTNLLKEPAFNFIYIFSVAFVFRFTNIFSNLDNLHFSAQLRFNLLFFQLLMMVSKVIGLRPFFCTMFSGITCL